MGVARGRPGIDRTIPQAKLLKAYEVYGSARAAADAIGIDHTAMSRFLKRLGIEPARERKKPVRLIQAERKRGQFAKWLIEHPNIRLPSSMKEIAVITGCSYYAVSCHYYRQRELVRKRLAALSNIGPLGALLQTAPDESGHMDVINTRSFTRYFYDFDPFSLEIWIMADTKDQKNVRFPVPDLDLFEQAINQLVERSTRRKE